MKKWTTAVLALAALAGAAFGYDFLYMEGGKALATRSPDPFARLDRVARVETLPSAWVYVGDEWLAQVEYAGETWLCRDGTIVPVTERPKVISKLDLLLVLSEMGKLEAFFAWLEASGLKPFWDAAQLMTTDHPLYGQALESVQEALGVTDEERDEILERIAK